MWTLTVPVLSTVHLPGPDAHRDLNYATSPDDELIFVRLTGAACSYYPDWAQTIYAWASKLPWYDGWIRFDSAGDEIDALPRYDDMWP